MARGSLLSERVLSAVGFLFFGRAHDSGFPTYEHVLPAIGMVVGV